MFVFGRQQVSEILQTDFHLVIYYTSTYAKSMDGGSKAIAYTSLLHSYA